ncbi:CD83 antigen isoform X1 [Osmerus mordax]|uniref:CD83 antigen isoform X1 n=1 Tax=Osmerus mordax TaxID=8014 RepID=UPI00350FBD13
MIIGYSFATMLVLVVLQIVALAVSVDIMEDAEESMCSCGEDAHLRCTAFSASGVQYRAVRWYKINKDPYQLSGLLTRNLTPPNKTRMYAGLEREVELLNNSVDIILPNVTGKDSGSYLCLLAAPVGNQNQEGQIRLKVSGCPDIKSDHLKETDFYLVYAILLLVAALLIYIISYACLKQTLMQRNKRNPQEVLLDKPLEKNDLMLIYTLGPNWSRQGQTWQRHDQAELTATVTVTVTPQYIAHL